MIVLKQTLPNLLFFNDFILVQNLDVFNKV